MAPAHETTLERHRIRLRAARLLAGVVVVLVAVPVACDSGFVSEAPPPTCTESGAQCQLSDGPLGVCERTPCPAGEPGPCFACTPQH